MLFCMKFKKNGNMYIMNGPLIMWCVVAMIALAVVIARYWNFLSHGSAEREKRMHRRLLEIGHECEEIYLPGDTLLDEEYAIGDE